MGRLGRVRRQGLAEEEREVLLNRSDHLLQLRSRVRASGLCRQGGLVGPADGGHPLKRAGWRGEGKWERVSWNQVLDEISSAVRSLLEQAPALVPAAVSPGGIRVLLPRTESLK